MLDFNKEDSLPNTLCSICCVSLNNTYSNAKKIQKFQMSLKEKFKSTFKGSQSNDKYQLKQLNHIQPNSELFDPIFAFHKYQTKLWLLSFFIENPIIGLLLEQLKVLVQSFESVILCQYLSTYLVSTTLAFI